MLEPFQLPFVQRGLIEILLLSIPAGLLGSWIVLRGLAFFSHAVGTAAFPGLVLAEGLGFSAALGAFGAAAGFALATSGFGRRRATSNDSLTALILVGCLAAGVILASDVFHSGANIEQLLFGSLLLIDAADIRLDQGDRIAVEADPPEPRYVRWAKLLVVLTVSFGLGSAGLLGALVTGRPELVALTAPFLLALGLGLALSVRPRITASMR